MTTLLMGDQQSPSLNGVAFLARRCVDSADPVKDGLATAGEGENWQVILVSSTKDDQLANDFLRHRAESAALAGTRDVRIRLFGGVGINRFISGGDRLAAGVLVGIGVRRWRALPNLSFLAAQQAEDIFVVADDRQHAQRRGHGGDGAVGEGPAVERREG